MIHQEFESPEELRDTIKCFWYNRRDCRGSGSSFEVLPDGYAEIIFHFGSPCSLSYDGELQLVPSPFVMGLLNHPILIHCNGRFEIIGIRCYPWTVFDLLGLPSGKDKVRVFEHPIVLLQSDLQQHIEAGRVEEAIALVRNYFSNALSRVDAGSMLFKAGAAMRATNGGLPVNQVAATVHMTVRTLERKFKQSSGHTVKDVSGLIRFEQVRNRLWLHPDSSLASLAHEMGYADQSHLSREFKRYCGATPGAFARKAKIRRMTISDDFVVFVQA